MRLVPHDQNTGGFFVCVLEKDSNGSAEASTSMLDIVLARQQKQASASTASTVQTTTGASKGEKRAASPSALEDQEGKKVKLGGGEDGVTVSESADGQAGAADRQGQEDGVDSSTAAVSVKPQQVKQPKKEKANWGYKEDPYVFVDPAHAEIESLV